MMKKSVLGFKNILIALLLIFCFVGGIFLIKGLRISVQAPDFFAEDINDRFYAYASKVTGKQSLYVAKLQQVEVFERTSSAKALWFDLPSIILRAEAPVEYNYFIDFTAGWTFEVRENELHVYVPELTNSTPAIDVAKMRFRVEKGSFLRNEKESLKRLEQELPSLLVDRSIANRSVVREQARESAANFVKAWLTQNSKEAAPYSVQILFPGEHPQASAENFNP